MINPILQAILMSPKESVILNMGYGYEVPIISAMWSLEQGDDASQCTIVIPGDRLDINDRLLSLKPYQPQPPTSSNSTDPNTALGKGGKSNEPLEHERAIVAECVRQGVINPKQIAYILATANHETGGFVWLTEIDSGSAYEGRSDLGNTQPGDGRKFKGRGYVQLTGRRNYTEYSSIVGKDLVGNPSIVASNQDVARFVLVHGMKTGRFTGAKLGDYTDLNGNVDYVQARRIVNGQDRAAHIAGKADQYEQRLKDGNLSQSVSPQPPSTQPTIQPNTIASPNTEAGGKLVIRLGEWGATSYEYVYLLSNVALNVSVDQGAELTLNGISPLWAINQYKQISTKQNISLKQLAKLVADERKLTLDFQGEGSYFKHLEQNGITNYQLLLRESSRAGYVLYHEGTKLIMHPIKQKGLVEIALSDVVSLRTESKPGGQTPGGKPGLKGTWNLQPTIKQDTRTSQLAPTSVPSKPVSRSVSGKPEDNNRSATTTGRVNVGNGKQITELSAQAEVARVKDNPGKVELLPRNNYWGITPSSTIKIPNAVIWSEVLGGSTYWVSGVHFSMDSQQGLSQSLDIYKPGIEVAVSQAMSGQSGQGVILDNSVNALGWRHPYPGGRQTGRYGEQRSTHRHSGIDFAGGNGVIVAAASGTVSDIQTGCRVGDFSCGGGYGNYIDIISNVNGKQYLHRYAHLASLNNIRVGLQVQSGQQIGVEGNTGHSFGNHLHFEIRNPNNRFGFAGTIDPASVGIK
jgi:murein DD-endopeptidase MepM/ murein hydrolase activator NlpD/predicted chitinase